MTEHTKAIQDVIAERRRQIMSEGWAEEHDDAHVTGSMAMAAACYAWSGSDDRPSFRQRVADALWARFGSDDGNPIKRMWPWAQEWWKPKSKRRDLVRAGALILAEIERMDRQKARDA